MRILLDTNILLSAALFPNGIAAKAYNKAVMHSNKDVACEWSIDELHQVFNRKFPNKIYQAGFKNYSLFKGKSVNIAEDLFYRKTFIPLKNFIHHHSILNIKDFFHIIIN